MATEGSPPAGSPPAGSPPAEPSTSTETEIASTAEAPVLPGIYTDPNFVLGDTSATWRYGRPPDYSKTRRLFAESKSFMILCRPRCKIRSTSLCPRRGRKLQTYQIHPLLRRFYYSVRVNRSRDTLHLTQRLFPAVNKDIFDDLCRRASSSHEPPPLKFHSITGVHNKTVIM